ncbi:alpha/beta hydrolase [Nocardia sp. NPDC050378]|uniref:alpha/beta fold hydrolase n=1 Tax=Nocardia sp. NPDC050378 TaxID=3155400 RepID=UPI003400D7AB
MIHTDIVLGDATLRATVRGQGPTVLLLHAGGERRGVWSPIAARLAARGYRTVAVDLRGHGDSSGQVATLRPLADDVAALIGRDSGPVVVAGASLGGFAAIAALAEPAVRPRVAGLILVDVVPDPDPEMARTWLRDQGFGARLEDLTDDILGSGPALLATISTVDLPILLVRGGRSFLADADVHRLRRANRHVTTAAIAEAGHLVARDAPEELADLMAVHADSCLDEDTVRAASEFQRALGAERVEHPGGNLLDHLRRVHNITTEWNAPRRTRLAAICHATYGTDGFATALLPTTQRHRLAEVIGCPAEELVYRYGACARTPTYRGLGKPSLRVTDRFTDGSVTITGADLHAFAVLTIANELDVARHARLTPGMRQGIRDLVTAFAHHAPREAAKALADAALAAAVRGS